MILTKYANIKVSPNNYKRLEELGYVVKVGEYKEICVDDLSKGSGYIVDVECDVCGTEKKIQYRMYLRSLKTKNIYTCASCNHTKKEVHLTEEAKQKGFQTKLEKYGDKHFNNRVKYKETCLENYGVENTSNVEDFQDKWKQTNMGKYGVENVFQLETVKEKSKETKFERYGDKNYNNIDKRKRTCLEKYGVESVFYNMNNEKRKIFCLEKYGDKNYNNRKKYKETMLKLYGVEHPTQNEEINKKAQETKIRNGFAISKEDTEFDIYKKSVKRITNKYKKELFENWDGTDYYDGEYIKDETEYNSNRYRSIDHKVSVIYGYKNNIDPETIGNIDNLCLTKRIINSTKRHKTEGNFNI